MTKEEATCLIDALITASEMAPTMADGEKMIKIQVLRDNLRGYAISQLVDKKPATVYREPVTIPVTIPAKDTFDFGVPTCDSIKPV